MRRLLLLGALALCGCTERLTPADAAPYQACAQDSDCVLDSLECNSGCGGDIAVARDQQEAFDQLRGCWPPSSAPTFACDLGMCPPVCSAGRCAVNATGCFKPPANSTSSGIGGTSGTTGTLGSSSTGSSTTGSGATTGGSAGSTSGSGSGSGSSGSSGSGSGSSGSGSTT